MVLFVILIILVDVNVFLLYNCIDNKLEVRLLLLEGNKWDVFDRFCIVVLVNNLVGLLVVIFCWVECWVILSVDCVMLLNDFCNLNWLEMMVELILFVIILDIYYFYIFMVNY